MHAFPGVYPGKIGAFLYIYPFSSAYPAQYLRIWFSGSAQTGCAGASFSGCTGLDMQK